MGLAGKGVDGQPANREEVAPIIQDATAKAKAIYRRIRDMDFEALKSLVMLQECYQLKLLFEAAGMDWRPTPDMVERVKGKPLTHGLLPHGTMMTDRAEYRRVFGIDAFAREVLGHHS